jgi:tRNA(His) 5'-end guanylyltransferase
VLSYIQSDEISLVFKDSNIFNGRVEKLNSIIASYISVEFNKELMRNGFGQLINELNLTIIFDSRILVLPTLEFIMKYLLNRQRDCINNALHSYCFYLLVKNGNSPAQAERILRDMKTDGKKEMLRVKFEIIFDEIPPWQRLGTILSFERFRKQALNQKTQEPIEVTRKRILIRGADDYLQNSSILFNLLEQSFK